MRLAKKVTIAIYLILCLGSLALIWFKVGDDPLAGIFAIFLAMPWSLLTGNFATDSVIVNSALMILGFAINAAILGVIFSLFGRRRKRKQR